MGGIGSAHSYAAQTAAFMVSLLLPASVFALLIGAWWEQWKRKARSSSPAEPAAGTALSSPLASTRE